MQKYIILSLLLMGPASLWAQDHFGRNAPTQQLIHVNKDGALELLYVMCSEVPVAKDVIYQEEVVVEVNGKKETKTVQKIRPITKVVTECHLYASPLDSDSIKAFETDGRAIDPQSLNKRLSKATLVVVAGDDKMIAPYYASMFKPGTVIVALPPPGESGYAGLPRPDVPVKLVSQAEEPKAPAVPPAEDAPAEEERPAPDLGLGIELPKSAAPTIVYARVPDIGKVNLRSYSEQLTEREIAAQVIQKGVPETVLMKQLQKWTRSESTQLEMSVVTAMTADSMPLSPTALAVKLKVAAAVLTSSMGASVDPFWLVNVKAGVVVLKIPAGVIGNQEYDMPVPDHIPPQRPPGALPLPPSGNVPVPQTPQPEPTPRT